MEEVDGGEGEERMEWKKKDTYSMIDTAGASDTLLSVVRSHTRNSTNIEEDHGASDDGTDESSELHGFG